jgi:hypothetical protein
MSQSISADSSWLLKFNDITKIKHIFRPTFLTHDRLMQAVYVETMPTLVHAAYCDLQVLCWHSTSQMALATVVLQPAFAALLEWG